MSGITLRRLIRSAPVLLVALGVFGCIDWKRTTATPED